MTKGGEVGEVNRSTPPKNVDIIGIGGFVMVPDANGTIRIPAPNIALPMEGIEAFCRKWKVKEFALFGSVLREDFGPESDVDVLVSFEPRAGWSLWDLFDMRDELKGLFGREVDLIEKEGLRNPFRKHEILTTRRVLYAA